MSCQPSPSKSRKAAPAPRVSGRNFLPKAPLVCLKRMPAFAVTSTNVTPEAAGGAGDGAVWATRARTVSRPSFNARLPRDGFPLVRFRRYVGSGGSGGGSPPLDSLARIHFGRG